MNWILFVKTSDNVNIIKCTTEKIKKIYCKVQVNYYNGNQTQRIRVV